MIEGSLPKARPKHRELFTSKHFNEKLRRIYVAISIVAASFYKAAVRRGFDIIRITMYHGH